MPPIRSYPPAPTGRSPVAGPRPATVAGGILLLVTFALAGCGAPPELRDAGPATPTPAGTGGPTSSPTPPPVAPVTPPPMPPTPAVDDAIAGPCPNGPTGSRVVSLVRGSAGVVPAGVGVRVRTGPVCAGQWHYSVLDVTGHEALQVISRSDTGRLRLVTAGTDVCTVDVRTAGPTGIRAIACDGAPVPGSGPFPAGLPPVVTPGV